MRCEEIMKKDPECIAPDDTCQVAARKMRDAGIGFLPVCDSAKKPLGTITDRDLTIRLTAEGRPASTAVSAVMTSEVIACRPSDDIGEAMRLMRVNHKSRILCIDDAGRVAGVISLSDVAQVAEREGQETLREVSAREAHLE